MYYCLFDCGGPVHAKLMLDILVCSTGSLTKLLLLTSWGGENMLEGQLDPMAP